MDLVTFASDKMTKNHPKPTNGRGRKIRHQNRVQAMQERLKRAQWSSKKDHVSCSLNLFDHLKCWKNCTSDIHQQISTIHPRGHISALTKTDPLSEGFPHLPKLFYGKPHWDTHFFFGSGFGVGEKSPPKIFPPVGEIPKIQKVSFLDRKTSSKIWVKFMIYMVQYLQIGISIELDDGKFLPETPINLMVKTMVSD